MAKKQPDDGPVLVPFPVAFEVVHDFVAQHEKGKRLPIETFTAAEAGRLLKLGAIRIVTHAEASLS